MAELQIPFSNGNNTVEDEALPSPGFLRRSENWIYLLDDANRLHKIPGRTNAGALPSGANSSNTYGIVHAQYENEINQILLLADSKMWESQISTITGDTDSGKSFLFVSLGSWSEAKDQQGTPSAFTRSGTYLKSVNDGRNRVIAWTGRKSERALIRDEDGHWRYLSLKKPPAPTLDSVLTGAANQERGASDLSDTAVTGTFTNAANAYDGDNDSYAFAGLSAAGSVVHRWDFVDGVTTVNGYTLNIKLATSSLIPALMDGDKCSQVSEWGFGAGGGGEGTEDLVASLKVEVSEDSGSNFTTIFEQAAPVETSLLQYKFGGSDTFDKVQVKVTLTYDSGTTQVYAYVFEIWASDGGDPSAITTGTYYYVQTEVFKKQLNNGKTIQLESAPSDPLPVDVTGTKYGVKLNLGSQTNVDTDGIADSQISRRIYRSTSTGSWPNLGRIAEVGDITETTFTDVFETSGSLLGAPSIFTATVGEATINAAGQAPAIKDAALFRGALVAIPANDPRRFQWSLPGYPEYFPLPAHDLALLPSDRNDELKGVVSIGDSLLFFTRTQVFRVRNLPFVGRSLFDLGSIDTDILSPNEGLAGTPQAFTLFESQLGHALVAWVSDNGIWMTDASLPTERGMGVRKVSTLFDWEREVDTTRLDETTLTFDPVLQIIFFDYYNQDGDRKCATFHTSAEQWVTVRGRQLPKWTGPHPCRAIDRAIGEINGVLKHWSLDTTNLRVENERTGTDDVGSDISSFAENGWVPGGSSLQEIHIYEGKVYHSDWGASEALELGLLVRRDASGVVQHRRKRGISLRGARSSGTGLIDRAGNSFKIQIRHTGKTTSTDTPVRALGPIHLEAEFMGESED